MTANNLNIADIFEQIADILDIQGGNYFRIRAYRQGAPRQPLGLLSSPLVASRAPHSAPRSALSVTRKTPCSQPLTYACALILEIPPGAC